METRVVVEKLLRRIPDIELDTTEQAPEIRGIGFRSPLTLPVAFTPEGGDHQIRASDWTDEDLLTFDEGLNRLKRELGHALDDVAALRADGTDEDAISLAEHRVSVIRARVEHLDARNLTTAPTQPTGGI
jgi:hypothetical protein